MQAPEEPGQQQQRQLRYRFSATPVCSAREAGCPGRIFVPSHHCGAGRQHYRPIFYNVLHVRDTGARALEGSQWALDRDAWIVWVDLRRLKSRWEGRKETIIPNAFLEATKLPEADFWRYASTRRWEHKTAQLLIVILQYNLLLRLP